MIGVDKTKLVDLKQEYVVVKKFNGETCYYGTHDPSRPNRWAHNHNYRNARHAIRFSSKEIAQVECDKLNVNRKKVKFKVDLASRHFVSNFVLSYNKYNNVLEVINRPISIQDFKDNKTKLTDIDALLPDIINTVDNNNKEYNYLIKNQNSILKAKLDELSAKQAKEMSEFYAQFNKSLTEADEKIKAVQEIKQFINKDNLGTFIESLKTESDNKFQILFGKGDNNGNT